MWKYLGRCSIRPLPHSKLSRKDYYSNRVLSNLNATDREISINNAVKAFDAIRNDWLKEKGDKYKDAIIDSKDFTDFVVKKSKTEMVANSNPINIGTVVKVSRDKNNNYYGFISREPNDIFCHGLESSSVDFATIHGKSVAYDLREPRAKWEREKAVNVRLLTP
ncbi:hypothetical protein FACS1894208_12640 [Clostridia bacterium]|nr:hypothetical protein FACS1894208_12640 [Clostridia bacterium]